MLLQFQKNNNLMYIVYQKTPTCLTKNSEMWVHTKHVGMWYLCLLDDKNLGDLKVLPQSNWELCSSGLLTSE